MSSRTVLLIGCGRIAGGYNRGPGDTDVLTHALAVLRHPGFSLAACVDPDPGALADFRQRWNVPAGFESLDDALHGRSYDLAIVASPTSSHLAALGRLLDAPVAGVICEKPMGGEAAPAVVAVEAYASARKPLAVAFPRRWDATMVALRGEIAGGAWGALRTGHGVYGRGAVNNGSHMIDLVDFLTGGPLELRAVAGRRADGVDGDPTVDAVLGLPGGGAFHMAGADGRDHALFELSLVFEKGIVAIEESGFLLRRRPAAASARIPGLMTVGEGRAEATRYGEALVAMLEDMANVLARGGAPASDGHSALRAIALADGMRVCARDMEKMA